MHEFVEIQNAGATTADLSGWKLAGGIAYTFPAGTPIAAGGFRVIALNPARLATVDPAIPTAILGPYTGTLSNNGDTGTGATTVDDTSTTNVTPFNGINGFQAMAFDSNGNYKRVATASDTPVPTLVRRPLCPPVTAFGMMSCLGFSSATASFMTFKSAFTAAAGTAARAATHSRFTFRITSLTWTARITTSRRFSRRTKATSSSRRTA